MIKEQEINTRIYYIDNIKEFSSNPSLIFNHFYVMNIQFFLQILSV